MFSVIIPLYNKELSISSTIKSILGQTFQDFEIVVVNDGSTDDSLAVVEKIDDPRIHIFTKNNGGESSARNYGIKRASRQWIALIDADDLWKKDHLSEVNHLIDKYPDKKVFTTSFIHSGIIKEREISMHDYVVEDYFKEAKKSAIMWSSMVVISKECFTNAGFFNEMYSLGEDLDMWTRLAKKYEIVKSSKITAIYRIDAENRVCRRKFPITKIRLFNLDLKNSKGSEREYYKYQIVRRFFSYIIKDRDFRSAFYLLKIYNIQLFK